MRFLSLPKSSLLTKPEDYNRVYAAGKRLRGKNFSLIFQPNGSTENRLGISVHGIKGAVRRNRIKRIIREFYRLNRNFMRPAADIVFAVRKDFAPDSPREIETTVRQLVRQAAIVACHV